MKLNKEWLFWLLLAGAAVSGSKQANAQDYNSYVSQSIQQQNQQMDQSNYQAQQNQDREMQQDLDSARNASMPQPTYDYQPVQINRPIDVGMRY